MSDAQEPDFLDGMIAESEIRHPGFTALVDAALARRVQARQKSRCGPSDQPCDVRMRQTSTTC